MTQNSKSNSSSSRVGMDKKKKLGRGLSALLCEVKREELLQSAKIDNKKNGFETDGYTPEGLNSLPLSSIDPLPGQPRKQFDQDALEELAAYPLPLELGCHGQGVQVQMALFGVPPPPLAPEVEHPLRGAS